MCVYTFVQHLFLKILTHLVLSVTSHDFFPLWSEMLGNEWDRRKWQYLYRHLYLSIPRIKAHCKMLQQSSSRSTLSNKILILCTISTRFQESIKYLYFSVICWIIPEILNSYCNLVGTSHSQVFWSFKIINIYCLVTFCVLFEHLKSTKCLLWYQF